MTTCWYSVQASTLHSWGTTRINIVQCHRLDDGMLDACIVTNFLGLHTKIHDFT